MSEQNTNSSIEKETMETPIVEDDLIAEQNLDQMMQELKKEADEEFSSPDENCDEIAKNDAQPLNELPVSDNANPVDTMVKKFKLFFVSDMDDEAKYLHEMSLKGLHFESKQGMQYLFKQGEVKNYYYHLSYYEKDKRDSERYLQNYEEAGWENIYHEKAEFDGVWNYFRIEAAPGEEDPNIFSDRVSRIALYKRLLGSWRSLLAMIVICLLFMLFICYFLGTHPTQFTSVFMTIGVVVMIVIVLAFAVYLRAYLKISRKLVELINI